MRTIAVILIGLFTATAGLASERLSAARDKAIRECNEAANKYRHRIWGAWEFHHYRVCMKRHDQKE
jgi:hypothetical protein